MASSIKITLDSENRENNKIIIDDVDMSDSITGIKIEWKDREPLKCSIDFIADTQ